MAGARDVGIWIMVIIMGRKRIGQGRVTKECLLRGHVRLRVSVCYWLVLVLCALVED